MGELRPGRLRWAEVPVAVRAAIEDTVGLPIVAVSEVSGGFSPGLAARLDLADGSRRFVKATGAELNPDSPRIYRMEARVAAVLPDRVPAPRLLGSLEVAGWVGLVLEYLPGRLPRQPWQPGELDRVLAALAGLPALLTPSPLPVRPAGELFGRSLRGLQLAATDPAAGAALTRIDPWLGRNLDRLAELEAGWPAAAEGDTLAHGDLRADNLLLTNDRVWLIDWPWACRAQPWFDLLGMLPSVLMALEPGTGLAPEQLVAEHPAFAGADPAGITAVLTALVGYFLYQSTRPPPPGLTTVRAFQLAQGVAALPWLKNRTGWR